VCMRVCGFAMDHAFTGRVRVKMIINIDHALINLSVHRFENHVVFFLSFFFF